MNEMETLEIGIDEQQSVKRIVLLVEDVSGSINASVITGKCFVVKIADD
jgi:hypothetical protein